MPDEKGARVRAVDDNAIRVRIARVEHMVVGEGQTFVIDGEQVAVFLMRSGAVRAVSAVCTHAGGPIADGLVDEKVVVCPLHQHTFDVVSGHSTSGMPPLRAYRAWVDPDGWVVVAAEPDG
jgi:nitrite reductase (NADH) small subunit